MATRVTLDDDVAARLRARARERGISAQRLANEILRDELSGGAGRLPQYRVPSLPLRARPDVDLVKALALSDSLDDRARLLGRH